MTCAALLPAALGIAIVAFTDNVLTGRAFATRNASGLDANQELLALGAANLAHCGPRVPGEQQRQPDRDRAGPRRPYPGQLAGGAGVRSSSRSSSSTRCSPPFPSAALGALVVYAAIRLVDVSEFRRITSFRRTEGALAIGTSVAVLVVGVLPGVLVAVALSVLDLIHRVTRPHDAVLGYRAGCGRDARRRRLPVGQHRAGPRGLPLRLTALLRQCPGLRDACPGRDRRAPTPARWFLLNTEANVTLDITAADTLESLRQEVDRRGIVFALARVKQELREDLERAGFVAKIGEERIFMTLPTAVQAYAAWSARD